MDNLKHWLEEKLNALNGASPQKQVKGYTRLSYTKEEKAAHQAFISIATELGLKTSQDEAGNQWAIWEVAASLPTIAFGSHLDTVNQGGGYDGTAGVLCALAAVKQVMDKNILPKRNIAIICFASEESARFGISTIGSKAITGRFSIDEYAEIKDVHGITLPEAIKQFGLDWERVPQAEIPRNRLESFVELHIEQRMELETKELDIGIVHGIACPVRLQIKAKGMANHTGTTPMENRQDALVALAPLIAYVEQQAMQLNRTSKHPIVATVSTVKVTPNAMNVIPGKVEMGIDIRSVDDEKKRKLASMIASFCKELASERNISIEVHPFVDTDSVLLDYHMQQELSDICTELGLRHCTMNSGAGHDVMNMAAKWPSGLIFIPCKDGISHHPQEYASISALANGTQVLARFIERAGDKDEN
ncbi:M20 family metallo-hydrolase [Virgibacillus sp. MG-45]|uniref:M20 family metallo-hydrolase n=1 Tax=Virgibacillus sp. MG-45 TaxID=3102791 RepID=UPI002EDB2995